VYLEKLRLRGKTAFITGGGRGIGLACADALSEAGAHMCQLVERSLTVPRVRHTVIYGASDNEASFWDNTLARHIGYRPKDSADVFRDEIFASDPKPDHDNVVNRLQGGQFAL
jgi:NAD(P)-dependent dehydrogenase (short-subunit alcohol dehydrogenase family)